MTLAAALTDDFDDSTINAQWDDKTDGVTETGGRLAIAYTNGERYLGALGPFDLRDSQFAVEVPDLTEWAGSGTVQIVLLVWVDTNNQAAFRYLNGDLSITCRDAGVNLDGAETRAYVAAAHRWWRVRADGSTLHFETSADGITWDDTFGETVTVSFAASVSVYLDIVSTLSAGSVSFDNFNLLPDAPEPDPEPEPAALGGSWEHYGTLMRLAAQERVEADAADPVACPVCGIPLVRGRRGGLSCPAGDYLAAF